MKELWIEEYDRAYNEALDKGATVKEAEGVAVTLAEVRYKDRFADMVDEARMMRKEGKM